MFPNSVSFIARERDKERYQEVEQIRQVKIAKLQQEYREGMLGKVANWLGGQMVKWGAKLQSYGSAPLPEVSSLETVG